MKNQNLCTGYDSPLGLNRRSFLNRFGGGLGGLALADLLHAESGHTLHHAAKAKRVIYLFQSGGPSQIDLFDHKPRLNEETGKELPDSVRKGQRLTGMSGNQASLPLVGSPFKFSQHGKSGQWISELLPNTAKVADDMCIVNSMYTEAINHGPGVTFMQTGSQFPGRPSMGAWLSHGLGSMNDNLPNFVTLLTKNKGGQPLVSRLWGSGFLPGKHAGTRFRADKDAILYLNSPQGVSTEGRRKMLDRLKELHEIQLEKTGDPGLETRIAQYEMAFRMQTSVPEVMDITKEPKHVLEAYGAKPGGASLANNCLLARRLVEKGVRFVHLFDWGWDFHGTGGDTALGNGLTKKCATMDKPVAALIRDLKQRGLLEDTLVVWGGEFGRTPFREGRTARGKNLGRDHYPDVFTMMLAGGGLKGGYTHGSSDELGFKVATDKVHVHDLQATILHLLGLDHERLTFKFQGRQYRLTDVHGHVVNDIIA